MIDPGWLLRVHYDEITDRERGAPSQMMLRGAVSRIYYALFHELCRQIADQHVGATQRRTERYGLVHRSLEHARAKDVCKRVASDKRWSASAADIGVVFVTLQEARHKADYDPRARFLLSDVRGLFLDAEDAIMKLREHFDDKPLFLTRLMIRERS